jgi:hypothetical protein
MLRQPNRSPEITGILLSVGAVPRSPLCPDKGRACIQGIVRHRGLSVGVAPWQSPRLDSHQLAVDSLQVTPAL